MVKPFELMERSILAEVAVVSGTFWGEHASLRLRTGYLSHPIEMASLRGNKDRLSGAASGPFRPFSL
jgi:hypothetical protein